MPAMTILQRIDIWLDLHIYLNSYLVSKPIRLMLANELSNTYNKFTHTSLNIRSLSTCYNKHMKHETMKNQC